MSEVKPKRKPASFRIDAGLPNKMQLFQLQVNQNRTAAQGRYTLDDLVEDAIKEKLTREGIKC